MITRRDWFLERLGRIPMFAACSKKELAVIGRQADDLRFEPGKVLVREGAPGSELFLILDGKASVTVRGRDVGTIGPGDFFGELAVLDPAPRDATVTALTPMEALVVGRREFSALVAEVPPLANKLLVGMARRLREADRKLNS